MADAWFLTDPHEHPGNRWGPAVMDRPGAMRIFLMVLDAMHDGNGTLRAADLFVLDRGLQIGLGWRRWSVGDGFHANGYVVEPVETRRAGLHLVCSLRNGDGAFRYLSNFVPPASGVYVIEPSNPAIPGRSLADASAHPADREAVEENLRVFYSCMATDPVRTIPRLCLTDLPEGRLGADVGLPPDLSRIVRPV